MNAKGAIRLMLEVIIVSCFAFLFGCDAHDEGKVLKAEFPSNTNWEFSSTEKTKDGIRLIGKSSDIRLDEVIAWYQRRGYTVSKNNNYENIYSTSGFRGIVEHTGSPQTVRLTIWYFEDN